MFSSLKEWFRGRRISARAHAAAWQDQNVVDEDGLTSFQRSAISALTEQFSEHPYERLGKKEIYLRWQIPGSKTSLFIYEDGAEIHGPLGWRAEYWDYPTPHDLIATMVAVTKINVEQESSPLVEPRNQRQQPE